MSEALVEELERLAIKRVTIKIGCLLLSLKGVPSEQGTNEKREWSYPANVESELKKALRQSRSIKNLTQKKPTGEVDIMYRVWAPGSLPHTAEDTRGMTFSVLYPLQFSLRVPIQKLKKWSILPGWPPADIPETFQVLYDGFTYALALEDPAYRHAAFLISPAVRDELLSILQKKGCWDAGVLGPTPIHPEIHVMLCPAESGVDPTPLLLRNDLYIPYSVTASELTDSNRVVSMAVMEVFWTLRPPLELFYGAMATKHALFEKHEQVTSKFSQMTQALSAFHQTSGFRFRERARMSRVISNVLSGIYGQLVDCQALDAQVDKDVSFLRARIKENTYACQLEGYMVEHASDKPTTVSVPLLEALKHAESEIRAHASYRAGILAALAGGAAGALIFAVIELLGG